MRIKPVEVMIVGAEKAGTSSLARYLEQHPNICTHEQLEMNYFIVDKEYLKGYDNIYRTYFKRCHEKDAVLLGKSAALMYLPEAVRRLRDHNANLHVIAVLRNPVERAYSAYWYAKRVGREYLTTFEEAISAEPNRLGHGDHLQSSYGYLDRGIYDKHLRNLFEYFPKDHIHIILFDDLKKDPTSTCRVLFDIFGLPSDFQLDTSLRFNEAALSRSEWLARTLASRNNVKQFIRQFIPDSTAHYLRNRIQHFNEKKGAIPSIDSETRTRLVDYFRPHNARLGALLGRDLSHWNR